MGRSQKETLLILTNSVGKTGYPQTEGWNWILISLHTKVNSKWIKYNVKLESTKFWEENTGKTYWHWSGNNYFGYDTKQNKSKNRQVGLHSEETINWVERQPAEWRWYLQTILSDKRLLSKTFKEFIQINSKSQATQLKSRQWTWKDFVFKGNIEMATRYMTCSMSLIIRKHKSKAQWIITSYLLEFLLAKETEDKRWLRFAEREPLYTVGGNVNWYIHYGKQ